MWDDPGKNYFILQYWATESDDLTSLRDAISSPPLSLQTQACEWHADVDSELEWTATNSIFMALHGSY